MSSQSDESSVRHLAVGPDSDGQRLDNFLLKRLKGVPKSAIYRIIRRGEVRVNRRRAKPTLRLAPGDNVRVPPVRSAVHRPMNANPAIAAALDVRYEDSHLIVINKPAGLAVHGGSGLSHSLIDSLRADRGEGTYLELVHRLDKDTSGCLVVAKRRAALLELQRQWGRRDGSEEVRKVYLALVLGTLSKPISVDFELARRPDAKPRSALSDIRPLRVFPPDPLSGQSVYPLSGQPADGGALSGHALSALSGQSADENELSGQSEEGDGLTGQSADDASHGDGLIGQSADSVTGQLGHERLKGQSRDALRGQSGYGAFHGRMADLPNEGITLIEVTLRSGRMHQARQHARAIGHPILGDSRYGDFAANRRLQPFGLRRLFLHASELEFQHPARPCRLRITAPLPDELQSIIDRLSRRHEPTTTTGNQPSIR